MPSSRVKCLKSSPTARVAEVKIQARGWSIICRRNSSADESGVTCSCAACPWTSTQRTSAWPSLSPMRARTATAPPALRAQEASPSERSEEHTSELQSLRHLVCRLLLEKKKAELTVN